MPDDRRGLGHRVGVAHRPGDAEVHDLDVAARREHDVAGLDVAVDDPRAVAVVQRREDARGDLQGPLGQDLAALAQDVAQGATGHELHDDVGLRDPRTVGGHLLAGVVDRDDRGVVERGRGLRLAAEPGLERRVAGQVGAQPLDRDDAAQPRVVALADLGHAATAEQLAELVAATDQRRARGRWRRGRGAHGVASGLGGGLRGGRSGWRPRCRWRSRSAGWAPSVGSASVVGSSDGAGSSVGSGAPVVRHGDGVALGQAAGRRDGARPCRSPRRRGCRSAARRRSRPSWRRSASDLVDVAAHVVVGVEIDRAPASRSRSGRASRTASRSTGSGTAGRRRRCCRRGRRPCWSSSRAITTAAATSATSRSTSGQVLRRCSSSYGREVVLEGDRGRHGRRARGAGATTCVAAVAGSRSAAANAAAVRIALRGVLGQRPPHHGGEVGGHRGGQVGDGLLDVGQRGGDGRLGLERPAAGEALERDHAERVDVGGRGGDLPAGLLGREVLRGAHDLAGPGQAEALAGAGDAEVGDLDPCGRA